MVVVKAPLLSLLALIPALPVHASPHCAFQVSLYPRRRSCGPVSAHVIPPFCPLHSPPLSDPGLLLALLVAGPRGWLSMAHAPSTGLPENILPGVAAAMEREMRACAQLRAAGVPLGLQRASVCRWPPPFFFARKGSSPWP